MIQILLCFFDKTSLELFIESLLLPLELDQKEIGCVCFPDYIIPDDRKKKKSNRYNSKIHFD